MSPAAADTIGPYRVTRHLSDRSVKARTPGGREFVLKHVGPAGSTAGAVSRYARAREIMHPSLANVVGVEDHGGERYLVYQFVKGLAVNEWVRAKAPSRAAIARLVRDAAETLDYLHKEGVVHGNPRAGNLIVTARGELRVIDIAPDPVADPVVDVKCLGELLRGALAAGGSDTSDDLDRVIERATAGAYASARAMAQDLRDYCDGRSLRTVSIRSVAPVLFRKEFIAGLGVLAAAAVLFGVLFVTLRSEVPGEAGERPATETTEGMKKDEGGRMKPASSAFRLPPSAVPSVARPSAVAPPVPAAAAGPDRAEAPEAPETQPKPPLVRAVSPKRPPKLPDGLEASEEWGTVEWGNPVEITVTEDSTEAGGRTLLVKGAAGGSKDKAVVHRAMELDLSEKRGVKLRVENAGGRRLAFAFAVTTKEGYFESLPVMLRPGWNEDVFFELRERTYKTERTGWKHETTVEGRSGVTGVYFLLYNGRARAEARLDAIRFE